MTPEDIGSVITALPRSAERWQNKESWFYSVTKWKIKPRRVTYKVTKKINKSEWITLPEQPKRIYRLWLKKINQK